MKDKIYDLVKGYHSVDDGIELVPSPLQDKPWTCWHRRYNKTGFADTYKVVGAVRHRRKYYIKYKTKEDLKRFKQFLEVACSLLDYSYKLHDLDMTGLKPEYAVGQIAEVITYYDIKD